MRKFLAQTNGDRYGLLKVFSPWWITPLYDCLHEKSSSRRLKIVLPEKHNFRAVVENLFIIKQSFSVNTVSPNVSVRQLSRLASIKPRNNRQLVRFHSQLFRHFAVVLKLFRLALIKIFKKSLYFRFIESGASVRRVRRVGGLGICFCRRADIENVFHEWFSKFWHFPKHDGDPLEANE